MSSLQAFHKNVLCAAHCHGWKTQKWGGEVRQVEETLHTVAGGLEALKMHQQPQVSAGRGKATKEAEATEAEWKDSWGKLAHPLCG